MSTGTYDQNVIFRPLRLKFGALPAGGKCTVYATGVQVARLTVTRDGGATVVVEAK